MAEYIERDKAIAICQSYYEHSLKMHNFSGDSIAYDIRTNIQGLPIADVVPVVRCKDCKHRGEQYLHGTANCNYHNTLIDCDDFCSYGERKNDNG